MVDLMKTRTEETTKDIADYIQTIKENKVDRRVDHFLKEVRALSLPKTIKATRLVMQEMSAEKGYARHDGRDYFSHPIAIAQTALDFEIISKMIQQGDTKKADILLTTCLLHDIVEDIKHITLDRIRQEFGEEVMVNVDNVTKRDSEDESMVNYVERVSSEEISSLVKILDRYHNVSTLSGSSLKHRKKQLLETRLIYLPLTKIYRRKYWENGNFFFQARMNIDSLLKEVERCCIAEEHILELESIVQGLENEVKELQETIQIMEEK